MMKNETAPRPAEQKKQSRRKELLRKIWKRLTYQWGWKLVSLALALCLWGGLITQDSSLPREKTFTDVKVNLTNEAALRQNGFVVVSGLEQLQTVKIKAQVPQKNYSSTTADRFTVRADLSQIKSAGEQTLRLTATSANAALYGTVSEISTPQITVQVEEYITRTRIPVQLVVTGESPAGFYADTATCDPTLVDISGPRSVVESIARCVAEYDMSALTPAAGTARTSLPYTFKDYAGNNVDDSLLSVTSQSVTLRDIIANQTLYNQMNLSVNTKSLVYGTPAPGYEVAEITVEPETVQVAVSNLALFPEGEQTQLYPMGRVSIEGKTEDVVQGISLFRMDGMEYMSNNTVLVTVSIRAVENAEQTE